MRLVFKALLGVRPEIVRKLADRLTLAATVWLVVGLAVSAFVVWAFAELADEVVEGESRRFDRAVLVWIHDHFPDWLEGPMRLVSAAGGVFLTTVLKAVFQRARPGLVDSGYTASFYSFPSGHATVAVGFYGALTLILAYRLRGFARWAVVVGGVSLVLLIGFSRIYLGVHYPTDVLAGYLAAPLWVISVGIVYVAWLSVRGLRTAEARRKGS